MARMHNTDVDALFAAKKKISRRAPYEYIQNRVDAANTLRSDYAKWLRKGQLQK